MNTDLLSGLLGGQGNNSLLTTLLPLLIGGKSLDARSLLSSIGSSGGKKPNSEEYPPLFGSQNGRVNPSDSLLNMLFGMMPQGKKEVDTPSSSAPTYPYELQYNRPFKE